MENPHFALGDQATKRAADRNQLRGADVPAPPGPDNDAVAKGDPGYVVRRLPVSGRMMPVGARAVGQRNLFGV